ncbi:MAG: hypothetical protein KKA55_14605 [Proteobacteria bacterium]|nr:hypothetical protein [Pseudomonadota bacterium]MBU1596751.1 hypothetical protein [Pseudomonadota bacterium]
MTQHHDPLHSTQDGPSLLTLPFGGLGLDLAEVRRKVSGLLLRVFPKQGFPRTQVRPTAPPVLSGYRLMVRLCRETLGS